MKVWNFGKFVNVEIGQKVLVARSSLGQSYFGEFGTLERVTKKHLVFKTDSGATVKTTIDNIQHVVGKAHEANYFVSLNICGRENDKNFVHENVRFWNSKKCCFENK